MDLTTLANLKAWIGQTTSADDVLLTRLVSQVSNATLSYLQRPDISRKSYTEVRNGVGNDRLTLRNWPVIDVTSVQIDGVSISEAISASAGGFVLMPWDGTGAGVPQQLLLRGSIFCRGVANVSIAYDAGYCIEDFAASVAASAPYGITVPPTYGSWVQDDGVTYADGTPLAAVNATPGVGQYMVTRGAFGEGQYVFNLADAGAAVLISYSYVPAGLEQPVIEWIAERYRYKGRIGQASATIGGQETAAYNLKAMPDYIALAMEPYKKSIPL